MKFRVDGVWGGFYTAPLHEITRRLRFLVPLVALVAASCAARMQNLDGPVSQEIASQAMLATAPAEPLQIVFDWRVRERDARFSGRGAARIQGPYQARLDLFGPRGETYLAAAMVGDDRRLPATVSPVSVPSTPLLWSVLGVVRPPEGARLVGSSASGDRIRLDYHHGADRWRFDLDGGRLRQTEWIRGDGSRHTVELKGSADFRLPREAVYRDWAAFNELTMLLDDVEHVEPFTADVWTPGEF